MASVLKALQADTKCLICKKSKEKLKILKCFHEYCQNCLAKHAELKDGTTIINCPSCRAETSLGQSKDVSCLTTSGLHSHIYQVLSTAAGFVTGTAGPTCSCKKPSTSYCGNCIRFLCKQCLDGHDSFIQGHRIRNLAELQDQDYQVLFQRPSYCENPLHNNEALNLYCNTCDTCICQKCLMDHRGEQGLHDIRDLEVTAEMQKVTLQGKDNELERKETEEKANVKYLEELTSETILQAKEIKTRASRAANELIAIIRENKGNLFKQIDEKVKGITDRKQGQEFKLQQLQVARQHLDKLRQYGMPPLVMRSKNSTQERLQELINMQTNLLELHGLSQIEFIPTTKKYQLEDLSVGSISTDQASDTSCFINLDSNCEALSRVAFSVDINDSTSEDCSDVGDVEIHVDPARHTKDLQVKEKQKGKKSVNFIPLVPGPFMISIKINGNPAADGPMLINVKPQKLQTSKALIKMAGSIAINKSKTKIVMADVESKCVIVLNSDKSFVNIKISTQVKDSKDLVRQVVPGCMAFLNEKDIVMDDSENQTILIVDSKSGAVLRCLGDGAGQFVRLRGVHVDKDSCIIVCDYRCVKVFAEDGTFQFKVDMKRNFFPSSAVSHGDQLIVSDWYNGVVYAFDRHDGSATNPRVIIDRGSDNGKVMNPLDVAIDNDTYLIVCDEGNNRIQKFTLDGRYVGKTYTEIESPQSLAVLADGRILVCNKNKANRVIIVE